MPIRGSGRRGQRARPSTQSVSPIDRGPAQLLLAGGDGTFAFAAANALRALGFAVDRAANGDTAVAMARDSSYDLIIVDDQDLTGRYGDSLYRDLRASGLTTAIAVIVSSSDASPPDPSGIGAVASLSKSADVGTLAEQVRLLIEELHG